MKPLYEINTAIMKLVGFIIKKQKQPSEIPKTDAAPVDLHYPVNRKIS